MSFRTKRPLRFLSLAVGVWSFVAAPQWAPAADDYPAKIRPLFERYCYECHGAKKQENELNLSVYRDESSLAKRPALWRGVLEQIETHAMPPDDRPQPSADERQRLVDWLRPMVDRLEANLPRDPGRVTLRRLNRQEYDNTVRDLIGLDLKPAEQFPLDDARDGFDNHADALTLPPLLLEKYLDAAERILDRSLVLTGPRELLAQKIEGESLVKRGPEKKGQKSEPDVLHADLALEREIVTTLRFPADGYYEIAVRAGVRGHGSEGAVLLAVLDGVDVVLWNIQAATDAPAVYRARMLANAGERKLALRNTRPTANQAPDDKARDVRVEIDYLEIIGPEQVASHRRIFCVEPASREPASERVAAATIVGRFAARAFRRPPAPEELQRLIALYDGARTRNKSYEESVRLALMAVLVSPRFLFRVELDSAPAPADSTAKDSSRIVRLDDYELASRLSYFLWSSMPDDVLLGLAAEKKLGDPQTLKAQVTRMLADPRSAALVENFAGQWLGLRKLDTVEPDRQQFRSFNPSLKQAMREEAVRFCDGVFRDDRSLLELIDADYTYMNEELAKHYGIKGIDGPRMRKVTLADRNRGGVLLMAGVLTINSYPTRTSAVKRGKWILEEMLGAPPAPPPPNVPELPPASNDLKTAKTLRERLERHRSDAACASCHKRMDVLGLGLENYDPIGRWRDKESGLPIDATGTLPGGEKFQNPGELKAILAARPEVFARALTEKLFVYALGRGPIPADRREVRDLVAALSKEGYRSKALIEGIVLSDPFRFRRAAEVTAEVSR